MAVPTYSLITPDEGHTGGVLVEILGTNFRVATEGEHVRIEFIGGPNALTEEASHVEVWSTGQIYCYTPRLDPFEVTTAFTADSGADTLIAAAHGLTDGTLVELRPATGAILPAPLDSSQAHYVVNATVNDFQVSLTPGGAAIDVTDTGTGTFSAISDGAYDLRITNLDDTGAPIGGETVTAVGVFRPVRPDLTTEHGILDDVLGQFMIELKRQIHPNVSWTVNTDYDDDTGDVEFAAPASLPALVITELELPENTERGSTAAEDLNYNDPDVDGDFICYRRGTIVDITGNILGISDHPIEILNLAQATRAFFQKNDELIVQQLDGTPINYQMRGMPGMVISPLEENSNVQWFTLPFKIVAVRIDEIPGLPKKAVPGAPIDGPTEAIVTAGKTAQIDPVTFDGIVLSVEPDDP